MHILQVTLVTLSLLCTSTLKQWLQLHFITIFFLSLFLFFFFFETGGSMPLIFSINCSYFTINILLLFWKTVKIILQLVLKVLKIQPSSSFKSSNQKFLCNVSNTNFNLSKNILEKISKSNDWSLKILCSQSEWKDYKKHYDRNVLCKYIPFRLEFFHIMAQIAI